jgi:hypothetical protein
MSSFRNPNVSQGSDDSQGLKDTISEADCKSRNIIIVSDVLIFTKQSNKISRLRRGNRREKGEEERAKEVDLV